MASDERCWAKGVGHPVLPWELVEAADHIDYEVSDEKLGDARERETMDARLESFFDSSYGSFDLTDVTVGGTNVEFDRSEFITNAIKFMAGRHDCRKR